MHQGTSLRAARLLIALAVCAGTADADQFELVSGGRVEGEWLNPSRLPREYRVRTEFGGVISLTREQVRSVVRERSATSDYEALVHHSDDSVESHWELAEWCRAHDRDQDRASHLRRILELQPNHVLARRGLGYSQVRGQWVTQEEFLTERGYVYNRGRWRLPQEVELLNRVDAKAAARQQWILSLRAWRRNLDNEKRQEAIEFFRAIRDPAAVGPLEKQFRAEASAAVRKLLLDTIAQVPGAASLEALYAITLTTNDREAFHQAIEHLHERSNPLLVKKFVDALKKTTPQYVYRASYALGKLDDKAAIEPLIDALIVRHEKVLRGSDQVSFTLSSASFAPAGPVDPDLLVSGDAAVAGVSAAYSAGGTRMQTPRGPRVFSRDKPNHIALDALTRLSGGVSFGYDQNAWRHWVAIQKRQPSSSSFRRE